MWTGWILVLISTSLAASIAYCNWHITCAAKAGRAVGQRNGPRAPVWVHLRLARLQVVVVPPAFQFKTSHPTQIPPPNQPTSIQTKSETEHTFNTQPCNKRTNNQILLI
jgi:hypothetical protein